jgi:hypothetical protein
LPARSESVETGAGTQEFTREQGAFARLVDELRATAVAIVHAPGYAWNLSAARAGALRLLQTMVDHTPEPEPTGPEGGLPDHIHGYRILGRLGRGGFADVYLACPEGSFRLVALKVLRANLDDRVREQVVSRFHTEENIARAIDHPAIVEILGTSPPGVAPAYIAMEYVDGVSFCEYFRRQRELPALHEVARLAHQVARAMEAAHDKGIVHRDLKPDNVLVTKGAVPSTEPTVRILDFGIAKAPLGLFAAGADRAITRYVTELGTVMGSPPFMAPEQNGAAHGVTGKADVFALGMMLLVVICGLDENELFGAQFVIPQQKTMQELLGRRPGLPEPWALLIHEMLAIDAQQRPDMRTVARRLQRLAQPHAEFGAAVDAWLERREVPSARRLRALLKWAESVPDLTADEQRFLRLAPAVRLPRRRWLTAAALVVLPLLAAGGAFGAARTWARVASPLVVEHSASIPEVAVEPQAAPSPSAPVCDSRVADHDPNVEAVALLQSRLDVCRRAQQADRGKANQLRAKLEVTESTLADLEIDAAESKHRLQGLQAELDRSREVAAEEGKKAFACNQELESRSRQLEESMQRWRVCAKGRGTMRGSVGAEPASTTSEPAPAPSPAVAEPSES